MGNLLEIQYDINAKAVMPKNILEEQCTYLNKMTNEIIIGRVEEYSGNIDSYIIPGFSDALKPLNDIFTEKKVNIQSALGEMGERQFTYEFFLTSRVTPDYKFRVLFMQYGIMGYPVKIVLEEGIADEIDAEHGYIYSVQSQEEYEEVLGKVLNSTRITDIVTRLIQMYNN